MKSSSKINGTIHYLWRAVDQHGNVLDVLVQSRRHAVAAKKFFRAHRAHKRVRAFGAVDLFDARLIRSEHHGACRSQGCGNPVLLQPHWVFNGPGCWKQLHDAVRPGPPHD